KYSFAGVTPKSLHNCGGRNQLPYFSVQHEHVAGSVKSGDEVHALYFSLLSAIHIQSPSFSVNMVLHRFESHYPGSSVCEPKLYYRPRQNLSQDGAKPEKAKNQIKMAGKNGTNAGAAKKDERNATEKQAMRFVRRLGFVKERQATKQMI